MAFRALVTRRDEKGIRSAVEEVTEDRLPQGNVLVAVDWSGLNYKDGMILKGLGNLVRDYPHVGGIDFAGRVIESTDRRYHPGQAVILTGWRVGERHWGGFAARARVQGDWLMPLPKRLSTRDAMVLGTAGLTAMLAINRIKSEGIKPADGEVLVTGAGGGVGSLTVMLLSRLGYRVLAATGRPDHAEDLMRLGAHRVIARAEVAGGDRKLETERWTAVVDTVGGPMLGAILKQLRQGGIAVAVGLAGGETLEASMIPFLLRGISLVGITSSTQPLAARVAAWDRLASLFVPTAYERVVTEAALEDLPRLAGEILEGRVRGRVVVKP